MKILSGKNFKVGLVLGLLFILTIPSVVQAQIQFFDFSGNSSESYQCFNDYGDIVDVEIYKDPVSGYFLCRGLDEDGVTGDDKAVLIPPTLQQLEVWFVRVLYVIWALVGSFSFFLLVGVGYEYLLRGGTSDDQLVKLRKRIINYVIGFALVFLAIPILTTVFRLLGVNTDVECYNVRMPGFQFFFTSICSGNETLLRNACANSTNIGDGLVCGTPGNRVYCGDTTYLGEDYLGIANGSVGASEGMYYICAIGTGSATRSTWVQYDPTP